VRSAGCTVRLGRWEAEETQQNHAKTMRRPCEDYAKTMRRLCEDHANNMLLAPRLHAAYTLAAGRVVAGSAEAEGVGHGRKEGADTNVPAWLINRAQYSITGTNFPG